MTARRVVAAAVVLWLALSVLVTAGVGHALWRLDDAGRQAVMSGSNGPVEPAADIRQTASALYQMFVALTAEGFNEQQALVVIGQILSASWGNGS